MATTQVSNAADAKLVQEVARQVAKRVVGQDYMVDRLLISILTGGHVLLEGVPGLAKTLTVRTLAETIDTTFHRIQFTPDLLPADVLGTQVYDQSTGQFSVKRGPIFANIILADEINRAPAKVQAALLEAMQEKQVTIGGTTFKLEEPFLVLATQNPIEQEGTYQLPEAQVDRFMLKLRVGYPTRDEEKEIMRRMSSGEPIEVDAVAQPDQILDARRRITELYMDDRIMDYIVDIVLATREPAAAGPPRPRAADRVRRESARDDRAGAGIEGARVPARPRVRDARRRESHRSRRAPPPRPHDVRGRGGGRDERSDRAARLREDREPVMPLTMRRVERPSSEA